MTGLDPTWTLPPEHLACDQRQVHVWRAALDLPAPRVQALAGMLERGELERAQRFSTSEDRWRYIVARAVLRAILARYLDCQPDRVRFGRGHFGKPMVAGESASRGLRFNVSHAHKLALYAVSRDREMGVDLEHIRANLATWSVAERLFSSRARAFLSSLPPLAPPLSLRSLKNMAVDSTVRAGAVDQMPDQRDRRHQGAILRHVRPFQASQ